MSRMWLVWVTLVAVAACSRDAERANDEGQQTAAAAAEAAAAWMAAQSREPTLEEQLAAGRHVVEIGDDTASFDGEKLKSLEELQLRIAAYPGAEYVFFSSCMCHPERAVFARQSIEKARGKIVSESAFACVCESQ